MQLNRKKVDLKSDSVIKLMILASQTATLLTQQICFAKYNYCILTSQLLEKDSNKGSKHVALNEKTS
ncbi:CLUMA_CG005686, isoform A [Clunio marinus]|uniref:CLUMA_CG005686, isoform A n=1 Tax=Clunio marinus TaxID=568069 RepID=A0A1J1HVL2_9DIPT|nr:CLUMA_CG005686, isoform A [Clunio marinus]